MYLDKKNLLDWIENKIKTRDYLNSSNPADVRNQLVSATKIIHDFESPKLSEVNGTRFSIRGNAWSDILAYNPGETSVA